MPASQAGDVGLAARTVRRLAAWREAGRRRHVVGPEIRVVLQNLLQMLPMISSPCHAPDSDDSRQWASARSMSPACDQRVSAAEEAHDGAAFPTVSDPATGSDVDPELDHLTHTLCVAEVAEV
jgi:hypothetical protein